MRGQQVWVGVVAVACVLTGCGADDADSGPSGRRPTPTVTSPPTATPGASTSATAATSAPVADKAMTSALVALAEHTRLVRTDSATGSARSAMSNGLAAARTGLKRTRSAAYDDTSRDCGAVRSAMESTRAGAQAARAASATLGPMIDARAALVTQLDASLAEVKRLSATLSPSTTPTAKEVAAAVTAAEEVAVSGRAALDDTREAAADGASKASDLASQAEEIYAKTC